MKITSFRITLKQQHFICVLNPNEISKGLNWKRMKDLCIQHSIEFKNQTFAQFIKEMHTQFLKKKSECITFTNVQRNKIHKKFNNTCANCNNQTKHF